MLSKEEKKEAIRQFKERKVRVGVYAVRCAASGQVWVGASRNLDATRNGLWSGLRNVGSRERSLQEAWNTHGEPAFTFDVLEVLKDDEAPLLVPDLLKDARQRWMRELHAGGLL